MNNFILTTFFIIAINLASAFNFNSLLPNLLNVSPLLPKTHIGKISKQLELKYHTQLVNHFDENDNRTFGQRYIEDRQFHQPGGPIIVFVGGQEGLVQEFIQFGPVQEIAVTNKGYLIYLEHRYMGYSLPFNNLSLENLQYLKVDQVLADIAHLIYTLKESEARFKDSKVILIGPSLSGTIVSWFRLKYPDLSVGGWASSGPVQVKADVPELKVEMGMIFERFGGKACYNKIRDGFMEIEEDLSNGEMTRIDNYLKVCPRFDPTDEKYAKLLINTLGALFSSLVSSTNQNYVEFMCEEMLEAEDNIEAIAEGLEPFLNGMTCLNADYNYTIEALQNEFDETNARAFVFLACYEYGWWTSTEAINQPFGTIARFDYFVDLCRDVFQDDSITRESMHKNAERLNNEYGGFGAKFTNLYTTQGLIDPNRVLGLSSNAGPTSPTEIIYGGTHANDLYYFFHDETGPIKKARLKAKSLISEWLQQ